MNIIREREDAFSENGAEAILPPTKRKKLNDDAILYQKHDSVAVRNEEGTFFLCKLMQDVRESGGNIKIRWYSEVKGETHFYRLDFHDHIQSATIIMNVNLKQTERGKYELKKRDLVRIENQLVRSLNVDDKVGEYTEYQFARSIPLPDSASLPSNSRYIAAGYLRLRSMPGYHDDVKNYLWSG